MRFVSGLAVPVIALYVLTGLSGCRKEYLYNTIGLETVSYDNSGAYLRPATGTVDSNAYVLRINYASDLADYMAVDDNNDYFSNNKPTAISVTTLMFFDSLHPANSSVADCFINGPGSNTANDVVTNFNDTRTYYPNHEPDDLWLMQPPLNPGTYSFVVRMSFDDGVVLQDTATVTLN